jgi:hypothetical protein
MNTHRSCLRRGRLNLNALMITLLAAAILTFGFAASTAQPSAEASGSNGGGSQLPPELTKTKPEDIEKDFNDEDLKVKGQKPRGEWGFGIGIDKEQFDDAAVPVAIGALQTLSAGGSTRG